MAHNPPQIFERRAATSARRRFADRFASIFVSIGGFAIIASVLGIFIFILGEVLPLFREAGVSQEKTVELKSSVECALIDDYHTWMVTLESGGSIQFTPIGGPETGKPVEVKLEAAASAGIARAVARRGAFHAVLRDGREVIVPIQFSVDFKDGRKIVTPAAVEPAVFNYNEKSPSRLSCAQVGGGTARGLAALTPNGKLKYIRRTATRNAFSGETEEEFDTIETDTRDEYVNLLIDADGRNIYAATSAGQIVRWRIVNNKFEVAATVKLDGARVTAMEYLLGDQSIAIGQEDGSVSIWFLVGTNEDSKILTKIREFEKMPAAVAMFAASTREKGFFTLTRDGALRLAHSTSERILWSGRAPATPVRAMAFAPKADGLLLVSASRADILNINNPHPEVSATALFGKVWYENNIEPEYSWQSSPGSNDIEPKFSLVPIIYGTLKGTFYSLLLAIPLAVLAAMYTSQFLPWQLRRYVKPVVEIMASLPSVVIGFIAGLWLAPLVANGFVAVILMVIFCPLAVVAFGLVGRLFSREARAKFPQGIEVLLFMVAIAMGGTIAILLSAPVERAFFNSDFRGWLLQHTGAQYNQSNAIVTGMAMGFAVIPIIFAVSEDAFSNVPKSLVSASLALGANRWQTVIKVVLLTASPGIFSGIMIGFGRAVGETMIVVMATGVTPIMEWSPFNGFRTLSANIANEIPEAPQGGTLYRILFLSGLLLFGFTFVVNTVAELVRQRLRKKYSSL